MKKTPQKPTKKSLGSDSFETASVYQLCETASLKLAEVDLPRYQDTYEHLLFLKCKYWTEQMKSAEKAVLARKITPHLILASGGDTFEKVLSAAPSFTYLGIAPDPDLDNEPGREGRISTQQVERIFVEDLSTDKLVKFLLKRSCVRVTRTCIVNADLDLQKAYLKAVCGYLESAAKVAKRVNPATARLFLEARRLLILAKPLPNGRVDLPEETVIEAEKLAQRAQGDLWIDFQLKGL